jgi:hypothetical protein
MINMKIKAKDLVVGEWYYIRYKDEFNDEHSFEGAAQYTYSALGGQYMFYSPLMAGDGTGIFQIKDIKYKADPLPTYAELLEYKRKTENLGGF